MLAEVSTLLTFSFVETSKSKNKAAAVNMDELVGNTDGFADSGYVDVGLWFPELGRSFISTV